MVKKSERHNVAAPVPGMAFLKLLKRNNNRNWFAAHKERFLAEQGQVEIFADALLQALNTHDVIETPSGKKCLNRIYRDIRFSQDKTPYKTKWSGSYRRAGQQRRGGYYFQIAPGNSFVAGGFWSPNPEDLKRIRDDIAFDAAPVRKITKSKSFVSMFGQLQGDQIKTTPKGFDAANEAIDLLRYKQFLLIRRFTDKEALSETFLKEADRSFACMRPFFDYMSGILATDTNGVPL
ncbi:MAG: DUF2461 domain-containing protein [Bacteroidota bacterium]